MPDIVPALPVDLWRIDLDVARPDASILSPDERERAVRFVFERDRRRYVAGRAALRTILGSRLGTEPERVAFAYGDCGKPRLAGPEGGSLHFNLSHSGELCLLALCQTNEIGIDVERIGPFEAAVAAEAFAPRECLAIERREEAEQGLAFATCWTRKEAFIKAIGLGFSYPSREVVVTIEPDRDGRVLACRPEAGAAGDWRLLHLEPAPGFVGAVAIAAEADLRWQHA